MDPILENLRPLGHVNMAWLHHHVSRLAVITLAGAGLLEEVEVANSESMILEFIEHADLFVP